MLGLPDSWVWDLWPVDDGHDYHLFFLFASRALGDPKARHLRASIGHAVSADLVHWRRVPDALVRSDPPAFDDLATWTGSVVRHPDGTWFLFYTGATRADGIIRQAIGSATSTDLVRWTRVDRNPVVALDPRWYLDGADAGDFRDPWVFPDPAGEGWHMLLTAKAAGPYRDCGVIGHAVSDDLRTWELRPPLTASGQGFSQLEVLQVATVQGHPVVVFSCFGEDLAPERATAGVRAGIWAAPAASLLGPFDLGAAWPMTDESLYSGRLVRLRGTDDWRLLAFRNRTPTGAFGGWIVDPLPVAWSDGRLRVVDSRSTEFGGGDSEVASRLGG